MDSLEAVKPVSHILSIKESIKDKKLRITLVPPPSVSSRTNSNICCVVDVSGSMGVEAKTNNSTSTSESYILSILDIVQHAIKMIINTLTPEDNLSVVAFSGKATVIFENLKMNDANKTLATEKIEALEANGSTNLWGGMRAGLDILLNKHTQNRNSALFVLTDGQPDDNDVFKQLKSYKKGHPHLRCTINTFGFGNASDSFLLDQLAREYNGMFSFIPDATLIATAFANALANTLTVFANYVKIRIHSKNGFEFQVPQYQPTSSNSKPNDVVIYGGVVNIQQNRDFIIDILKMPTDEKLPYAKVEVLYQESHLSNVNVKDVKDQIVMATLQSREHDEDIDNHIYRYKVIEAINTSMSTFTKMNEQQKEKMKANLMNLIEEMEGIHDQNDRHFDGIYKDLVRTVSEGFKNDQIYKEWGQHYLLSLLRAHLIQQCNTFKDPGVQHYGKSTFQEIRAVADEIFVKMPPPKPYSRSGQYQQVSNTTSTSQQVDYSSSYNMADYHNYSTGGCMHGDSLVLTMNSIFKKVKDIQKGDIVISPALGNQAAEVECVVISRCENEQREFVQLSDNLWITPKHPVRVNGEWKYPKELGEIMVKPSDFIYQFVLKNGHTMMIGGYECICLGHGFQEQVAYHQYLGSQQVIEDLKLMKGWSEGKVHISSRVRDHVSGQVKAFIQ